MWSNGKAIIKYLGVNLQEALLKADPSVSVHRMREKVIHLKMKWQVCSSISVVVDKDHCLELTENRTSGLLSILLWRLISIIYVTVAQTPAWL